MTVSTEKNKEAFAIYSGATAYNWTGFVIPLETDVEVYAVFPSDAGDAAATAGEGTRLQLTLTTHYTVTITPGGGGSVTVTSTAITGGDAVISGHADYVSDATTRIAIYRRIDAITQLNEYNNQGAFLSATIEASFDSLVYILQQHEERLGRTIQLDPWDTVLDSLSAPAQSAAVRLNNLSTGIDGVVYWDGTTFVVSEDVSVADLTIVVDNIASINAVSANEADITTVATNIADVNTVATNIADVNTVATNIADVTAVADNEVNVNIVAGLTTDVAASLAQNLVDIADAGDAELVDIAAAGDAELVDIAAAGDAELVEVASAGDTEIAALGVEGAAQAASVALAAAAEFYADTTAGLAAVADGEYFYVVEADANGDNIFNLYVDNSGTADLVASYLSIDGVETRLKAKKIPNLFQNGSMSNWGEGIVPRDIQTSAYAAEFGATTATELNDIGIYYSTDLSAVTVNRLFKYELADSDMPYAVAGINFLCGVLVYNSASFVGVTSYQIMPWWANGTSLSVAADAGTTYSENLYVTINANLRFYYATFPLVAPPSGVDALLFGQQGRTGGSGTFEITGFYCALSSAPLTIDDCDYLDHRTWQSSRQTVDAIATRVTTLETGIVGEVSLASSDWLNFIGDSYTQGIASIADQEWICQVSAFTDYTVENFATGGETARNKSLQIRENTPRFHATLGPLDVPARYYVSMFGQNDGKRVRDLVEFQEDLRTLGELIKSTGAVPIFAPEWQDRYEVVSTNYGAQGPMSGWITAVASAAQAVGGAFMDILPDTMTLRSQAPQSNNAIFQEWWDAGHPGTRTNGLLASAIVGRLDALLPPPRQFVKVFRARGAFASINDLTWSTREQRMDRLKEIRVGHVGLTAATAKYYDELVSSSGSIAAEDKDSEYLMLLNGDDVAFTDQMIVHFGLDAVDCATFEIELPADVTDLTLRLWDMQGGTYEDDTIYNRAETTSTVAGVGIGDTYTASDGAFTGSPVVFTVIYANSTTGVLVLDPDTGTPNSGGNFTSTAGTLTRTTGSGPASISYSYIGGGGPAIYYSDFGEPEGGVSATIDPDTDGVWRISDASKYMRGREVIAIFQRSGAFNLQGSPVLRYYDGRTTVPAVLKSAAYPKTSGSELAGQTLFDETSIADWTLSGGAADNTPFYDTTTDVSGRWGIPYGTTGVVALDTGDYVEQAITLTNTTIDQYRFSRDVVIEIWGGWFPPLFDSAVDTYPDDSQITTDLLGLGEITLIIGDPDGPGRIEITRKVFRFHGAIRFELPLPRNISTTTIRIVAKTDDIHLTKFTIKEAA